MPPEPGDRTSSLPGPGYDSEEEGGLCNKRRNTVRHHASSIQDRRFATFQRTLFIYLINKYISLFDICLTVHH